MGVPRPFRAVAYRRPSFEEIEGRRRVVTGRAAAATRAGLDRFVADHEAAGDAVDVTEILDLLDQLAPNERTDQP